MEMNKMKRLVLLLIVLLGTTGVRAQLGEAVKKIFAGDSVTTVHNTPLNRDSDSVYVANLQKSLEAARLNEANMRMEMEQMKLQMAAVDSVKYARQRQRIDSLRQFTKGIPVVADGDTLFYLFTKRGGYTPQQRAQMTGAAIEELGSAGHCCGGHGGPGMASNMGDSAANVAKDPVCGMSVDPATAAATREYGGVTYYFCNPGCADKFAQNPAAYLG